MTRRLVAALLVSIAALAAATRPSAQQVFSASDLTGSPYGMNGGLTDGQIVKKHEALAAIAEKAGDLKRATRHYAIACQYQAQSTRDVAMSAPLCVTARALADRHDVVDAKISMLIATGVLRVWTLNFAGAVTTLKEAIALGKNLNPDDPDSGPLLGAHQLLGSTFVEMGQFEEARQFLVFGRDHCRITGNAVCAAYADIWLCRLNTNLGDFSAARSACDAAQAEAAVHNDKLVLTNLGRMRGALEAAVHRPAAALAALQDAWRHASESSEPGILLPLIAQSIVDALIQLGRLDEAETWQRGLDDGLGSGTIPGFMAPQIAMRRGQIAALRGRLDEATTAFSIGSRSAVHEMSIRGYVGVARMHRYAGRFDAARDSLERAIDKIEEGRTNVTGSSLRTSYLAMHASAYRELVGVRWDAEGAAAGPAILELAEAGRARALLDALASAQIAGAQAPTLSAADIQARLAADEVLIEYVSSEERLIAITVTRDRIAVSPLERAGSAADLARRVDFFATMAQEGDESAMAPAAERLYADLLATALDGVAPSARTLIVSADGPLHRLPFDALGGATRVIDRWNVVMVPSASALAGRLPHDAPESPALIVTTPLATEPGLAPLAAAPAEAAMIRGRIQGAIAELSGADATKARLQAAHPERFAVLHFASHALVDEERPLRSALVLADGGRWTAEEIYRSKLGADLVVLAACSTGAGAVAPGEGVMSLSRAFLHAGAAATVATLWDVPDAPAPAFADALYRELTMGRPLGVAVAEARRELRRNGAPPRAWAAYVMTGNPGAIVGVSPRTPNRLMAAAVLAIIAGMLLIVALAVLVARLRWRFGWPQLATASVVLAASAMTLQWWPERTAFINGHALASRGQPTAAIAPILAGAAVTWTPVSGADEHVVEMFDESGVPAGTAEARVSPFTLPDANGVRWMRVVARRDGHTIAQSALMRVNH
jgi:CHAT domain-containing protein